MSEGNKLVNNSVGNYLRRFLTSISTKTPTGVAETVPPRIPQPAGIRVGGKRAVVISNCQCLPLAAWLTVMSADTVFDYWGVHVIDSGQIKTTIDAFVTKARAEYDMILAIPLSEDYLDLSTTRIADSFAGIPLIRISNIYFSGFHPDQTYIGGLTQRVTGPLGDAHSKLAIHGFMAGLTVDQTMNLFSYQNYACLGYFDEFSASLDELTKRDSSVDVPVTRSLEQQLLTALCFYSFNHPTPAVFNAYTPHVMQYLVSRGFVQHSTCPADPFICAENLAENIIFPVYPEIAAYHGVPHIGSYAFKPVGPWVNPMSLNRFLTLEFEAFEEVGREELARSYAAQNIAVKFALLQS